MIIKGERISVGLDVHAHSIVGAAIDTATGELISRRLGPEPAGVIVRLRSLPGPVAVTYEAGPNGYVLARELAAVCVNCVVAAPSKIRRAPGDRVKTDKRDAELLARLLLADDITPVVVPSVAQEAARDLVRAREDCRRDLTRARHRVTHLLLRHGIVYSEGRAWTGRHDRWLRAQHFDQPGTRLAFEAGYEATVQIGHRRDRLDAEIEAMAADSEYTGCVHRLECLRGISTLTGFALAVEIGDWHRFTGNSIGSFIGLVPSEDSSGERDRRGPVTKAGNGHVRRLLVETT